MSSAENTKRAPQDVIAEALENCGIFSQFYVQSVKRKAAQVVWDALVSEGEGAFMRPDSALLYHAPVAEGGPVLVLHLTNVSGGPEPKTKHWTEA